MLKKMLAAVTASLLLLVSVNCFAASNGAMELKIGKTDDPSGAYRSDGVLYLAVEPVCRAMGYTVSNTGSNKDIVLTNGSDTIRLDPANNRIEQNGHLRNVAGLTEENTLGGGCLRLSDRLYLRADLFSGLLGFQAQADRDGKAVTIRQIIQNILTIKTQRRDISESLLTARIQYPVLSGPWNSNALETINTVFEKAAEAALSQGRQNAAELQENAVIRRAAGAESGSFLPCETNFDYEITYSQNGMLSVILPNYQDAGGAHGTTIQTAYTFDLKMGKQIALSDLMKQGSEYQKYFDAQIRSQIDARVKSGALYEMPDRPFQTIGNKPDFYLSADGIVFFQEYEHFPYAAGIQEFPVSYRSISEKLNPPFRFLFEQKNRIG